MRPLVLVITLLVLITPLTGCLSGPRTGVVSDTETATETATTKPLPERPKNLSKQNVVKFTKQFETAYKWNREQAAYSKYVVNPVRGWANRTAEGYHVHLEVGLSMEQNGAAGDGFYMVNYFINESSILRAEAGGQVRPGPDPRDNGTPVGQ